MKVMKEIDHYKKKKTHFKFKIKYCTSSYKID